MACSGGGGTGGGVVGWAEGWKEGATGWLHLSASVRGGGKDFKPGASMADGTHCSVEH